MTDERRVGDKRPLRHESTVSLTWIPARNEPFRWLPRHGDPFCIAEWFSQRSIKLVAWLPVYTAIIVALMVLVLVFGVPFVGESP